jgi:hypothetical protein
LLDDDSKILWKSDTGSVLTSVSETDEEGAAAKREYLFVKAQELEAKVRRLIKQIDKEMEKVGFAFFVLFHLNIFIPPDLLSLHNSQIQGHFHTS